MTREETIIHFDKVISAIPKGTDTTGYILYLTSQSEYKENEYKGFRVLKDALIPNKKIYATPNKFHK